MKINPALLLLAATLRFAAVSPAADPLIANGGFEDGLAGWFVPKPIIEDGWTPKLLRDGAVEGAQCVEVGHAPGGEPKMFGNLMRSMDATPLRGKRVRFSVQVRHTGGAGSKSQPWLRVDRPAGQMGFFVRPASPLIRRLGRARHV